MRKVIARLLCASMVAGSFFSINTTVLAAPPTEEDIGIYQDQTAIKPSINPYERVEGEDSTIVQYASHNCLTDGSFCGVTIHTFGYVVYKNVDILTVAGTPIRASIIFAQCCPLLTAIPFEFNKVASSCANTPFLLKDKMEDSAPLL